MCSALRSLVCARDMCVWTWVTACVRACVCVFISFIFINIIRLEEADETFRQEQIKRTTGQQERGERIRKERTKDCTNHNLQFVTFEKVGRFDVDQKYTTGSNQGKSMCVMRDVALGTESNTVGNRSFDEMHCPWSCPLRLNNGRRDDQISNRGENGKCPDVSYGRDT